MLPKALRLASLWSHSNRSVFPGPCFRLVVVKITVVAISRMSLVTLCYFQELPDTLSTWSVISILVGGWTMSEEGRIRIEKKRASIIVGE